ncbi:MAG TPA: aminoacyl-tRNA hydrolase [Mycoplasmatales bacterium]|jgi:peptidyl-tRNA hydrolase, PTH1 family|nr:aminoacyl-tRNA hydrolase [Mycoplasmatales bacterium]
MKKAIFGLGNHGVQFKDTRHNAGSEALENLKLLFDKNSFNLKKNENWDVTFVKPKCLINESGKYIKAFIKKFEINTNNIIVIYDDKSIEFGKIKFKKRGSSGGHNGIKDIINELGTEEFSRIKIGIGEYKGNDLKLWILQKFTKEEKSKLEKLTNCILEILLNWINEKFE